MASAYAVENQTGLASCAFPGCDRPVRERAGDGGGRPPSYCDLRNPTTGKLAHTPLTAARERARHRQDPSDQPPGPREETPASAARERAVNLLEQFRAAGEQMTGTLIAAIEAISAAGDPENVSAELSAAHRQVERTRLEADERIHAAEIARDQTAADAATAHQRAAEAVAARDEAIGELDALDATLATTRAELEQTRADYAAKLQRLHTEHAEQLERLRMEAAEALTAAEQQAAEQIQTAHRDAAGRVQAAETARDQALTEASTARQAATDATRRAEETREELRQAHAEHRDELNTLRREHRDDLATERQRADTALDTQRTEHRRETEALQTALTALRIAQQEQPDGNPSQPAEQRTQRKR